MLALVGIGAQQGGWGEDEKEGHGNKNLTTQTCRIGKKVISLMGGVSFGYRGDVLGLTQACVGHMFVMCSHLQINDSRPLIIEHCSRTCH